MDIKRKNSIIHEIYKQLFYEAEPSVDYDKLVEYKVTDLFGWQSYYVLKAERQLKIIDEICVKNNCSDNEKQIIYHSIMYNGTTPLFTDEDFK